MNIEFKYLDEVLNFVQIVALGSVLSFVVMYIVEALKGVITTSKPWIFAVLAFVISMAFGVAWAYTFARETIDTTLSLWLGVCLFLGSQGFYKQLEESDGFIGKAFKSYTSYLEDKDINVIDEVKKPAQNEPEQATDDNSVSEPDMGIPISEEPEPVVQEPTPEPVTPTLETTKPKITSSTVLPLSNGKASNFKMSEFKCGCGGKHCDGWGDGHDIEWAYAQLTKRTGSTKRSLIDVLEEIRTEAQKKYKTTKGLQIMDGIRCKKYDDKLNGGKSTSGQHKKGLAADISMEGVSTAEIAKSVNSDGGVGTGGGHYPHVDRRGEKARWKY